MTPSTADRVMTPSTDTDKGKETNIPDPDDVMVWHNQNLMFGNNILCIYLSYEMRFFSAMIFFAMLFGSKQILCSDKTQLMALRK